MPDATTLATGVAFIFNNLATGTLTLQDYASAAIGTITAGGAGAVFLTNNGTAGGTWDLHAYLPEGVTFGTNAFNLGTAVVSGGTWQGGTIQSAYGGTGLTTFTAANNALYSTSASNLVAGTLPVAAGGTAKTSFTANQVLYGSLSQSANLYFDGTNLGIGTTNPIRPLQVGAYGSSNGEITIASTTTGYGSILFGDGSTGVDYYRGYLQYNHTSDAMLFATSSLERMIILSTGNVGIGTSTAGTRLVLATDDTATTGQLRYARSADVTFYWETGRDNQLTGDFLFSNANGGGKTERMRITAAGFVGIGTPSPGAKLDVYVSRTSSTNAISLLLSDNVTGAQTDGVYKSIRSQSNGSSSVSEIRFVETDGSNNNTAISFATQNTAGALTERMRVGPSGIISINPTGTASGALLDIYSGGSGTQGALRIGDGSLGGHVNYWDIGRDNAVSGAFTFTSNGTERMRLTTDGNLYLGYNNASNIIIGRAFATSHAVGNRGAVINYGIDDGSFGGMNVYNVASSNPSYNSQYIAFTTHQGAISAGVRMAITPNGGISFGSGASNYGSSGQLLQSNGDTAPSWINQSSITAGSATNVAGLVQNAYSSYTNIASTTPKNAWYGMLCGPSTAYPALMFESPGSGGFYHEASARWLQYYSYTNNCTGFNSSSTTAGYAIQVNGIGYATSDFRAPLFYDSNDTTYYADLNSAISANFAGSLDAATYYYAGLRVKANGTASTGGAIAIQQVTNEGWTGIFCDFEPYTEWGLWHDNPNNYFSFTAGASAGNIRSFTVPSRASGNRTAYEKFRVDQATGDTITGAISYAYASSRSPIFYDYNNTSYYLDPASRSNLYTFTMGDSNELNQLTTNVTTSSIVGLGFNGSDSSYAIFKSPGAWVQPLNIKFYTGLRLYAAYSYDYGISFWDQVGGGLLMSVGQGDFNVRVSNTLIIKGVIGDGVAPLQLIPASSSGAFQWASTAVSAGLGSGQTMVHFIGNALSAGNSGYLGFQYSGANSGSNFVSLGFYGNDNILRVYNGIYTQSLGSMRAPIFYDSDNTAFFIEGNANSVLYRLQARKASSFTTANDSQIELSNAGSGSCYISYHREGAYGAHFGLSTDNRFSSYGWSAGAGYTGLDLGTVSILQNNGTNSVVFLTSRPGVADSFYLFASDSWAPNGDSATMKIGSMGSTGRSINATGSVNQNGGDYAEYMTKNGNFTIAKGDVCGIDVNGKLTKTFSEAISFVVKSTEPGIVGGDTWGNSEALGMEMPMEPLRISGEADESLNARKAQYLIDKPIFAAKLEAARQKVDRIAFCGQVPVNVTGAVSGQYIVPVNDNGAIKGQAVTNPTFEQYLIAVGKVIKVVDGRPTIIVKVS
jgi:hypothetical protein